MAQLALFQYRPCVLTAGYRVFMATNASCMKYGLGLWWCSFIIVVNFILMAFVAWLHNGITRLMLVMAGRALCNAEICVLLMRKSNCTQFALKLDNRFIFRNRQALCHHAADKQ